MQLGHGLFRRFVYKVRTLFPTAATQDDGREARQAFLRQARGVTPFVAAELDGLLLFVSTRDRLGREVFIDGERQDMFVLERALHSLRNHGVEVRGSTFLDVGANIGTTTVTALKRHGFTRAVALEPEPTNFRMLRLNLVANDIDSQVTPLQVAAAARSGRAQLKISASSSGKHALVDGNEAGTVEETIGVRTVTLDQLLVDGTMQADEVGVLWIDTPGAEAAVLAGASTFLDRRVPLVTSVRPGRYGWLDVQHELTHLLRGYSHFVRLRPFDPTTSNNLSAVLDSFSRAGDVLAFKPGYPLVSSHCAPVEHQS
jgi:FkbM family methyltransferase